MARLPVPGSDDGTWGSVLNDYLSQSLDTGGVLKANSVPPAAIQSGAINTTKIQDGTITEVKLHTDVQDKLNAVGSGGATNLSSSVTASSVIVNSDTGTDATLAAASVTDAGVMTSADKAKLNGVATGATVNATDASLRDRATHTGTQAISTVTDLQTTLDDKTDATATNDLDNRISDVETNKQDKNYRYWQGSAGIGTWESRPSVTSGLHVEAYSVLDELAPVPPDAVAGDLWFRHPDAA